MKRFITCLAVLGFCAALAMADKPQPRKAIPQKAVAKTVQRITPDLKPVGPVYNVADLGGGTAGNSFLAYDCFEPDAGGAPTDGRYGIDCWPGDPTAWRWWFGPSYQNMYAVGDMNLWPGTAGKESERIEYLWGFTPPQGSETCYVIIWTCETFDDSCIGPPFDGVYDGVQYGFGSLGSGLWYTDVDLTGSGLFHQMPTDGSGGIIQIIAQEIQQTAIILASRAQPGLWGTKDNVIANPPGTNKSWQGPIQWDDDAPPDGIHDLTECYTYEGSAACPNPLGMSQCFYTDPPGQVVVRCDANCDGIFDGADIDAFFFGLQDPNAWQQQYPNCPLLETLDANNNGVFDGGDIDPFFKGLEQGKCPPT